MEKKEEPQAPSKIVPILVAALVCDGAVADPATGKKSLIGIYDRIWAREFPTAQKACIYMKLSDAEGFYLMEIRFVQLKTGKVLASAKGKFISQSRLGSADFFTELVVPIPEKGRYEFQIWANDIFLGSSFVDAEPHSQS